MNLVALHLEKIMTGEVKMGITADPIAMFKFLFAA